MDKSFDKILNRKMQDALKVAAKRLSIIFLILGISLGMHILSIMIPNNESYNNRIKAEIVHGCKSGWFSETGICVKYKQYLIENTRGAEEENICGEDNSLCKITGLKDYITYGAIILDFMVAILIARLMGLAYRDDKKIKKTSWLIFLSWNVAVLMLIYISKGNAIMPGDILRQIVEIIAFSIVFKIHCQPASIK